MLVLDAGAFVAVERGDRDVAASVVCLAVDGDEILTSDAGTCAPWPRQPESMST